MAFADARRTPWWVWTWPSVGLLILTAHFISGPSSLLVAVEAFALVASVFAGVYHAEVVALRVGEPFGTLVLV